MKSFKIKHELIMEFSDYFAEIWSLDVNSYGTSVISVSADHAIKIYELTQEQIIPDFEKERKIDRNIEEELQKDMDNQDNINPINKDIDKLVPIRKGLDNITFAENLIEGIDHAEKFKEEVYNYEISLEEYNKSIENYTNKNTKNLKVYNLEEPEKPNPSQFLLGKNIFDYILDILKSIRFSELENTLNNIPYSYVQKLFFYLEYYVRNVNNKFYNVFYNIEY
jgi:WD40 repeat protein